MPIRDRGRQRQPMALLIQKESPYQSQAPITINPSRSAAQLLNQEPYVNLMRQPTTTFRKYTRFPGFPSLTGRILFTPSIRHFLRSTYSSYTSREYSSVPSIETSAINCPIKGGRQTRFPPISPMPDTPPIRPMQTRPDHLAKAFLMCSFSQVLKCYYF